MANQRSRLHAVRQMCVIAHVDSGKTTLSDSLLSAAHVLNAAKAGTALALDTDKEEQERGITIKSTGICLRYPDVEPRQSPLAGPDMSLPATEEDVSPMTASIAEASSPNLYLGSLPFVDGKDDVDALRAELTQLLEAFGPVQSLELRAARGFAQVTFATVAAASACLAAGPLAIRDRNIMVEEQGHGPIQHVRDLCQERGWQHPQYDLHRNEQGVIVGTVRVPDTDVCCELGDAVVANLKAAKRHLATTLLMQLLPKDQEAEADNDANNSVSTTRPSGTSGLTINLIDCPGHVDFSGEVTAALRISDGAMVVVDAVDGVGVQTETVLRQALAEYVRPVLFINKVDRLLGELQCSPEEAYLRLEQALAQVNSVISMYQPAGVDFTVSPDTGNVAFGSGLYGWGFTLHGFAQQLLRSKGTSQPTEDQIQRMVSRLWGAHYHDRHAGHWQTHPTGSDGSTLPRAFCAMVLQPIYDVHRAQAEGRLADLQRMAERLGLDSIRPSEWETQDIKELRKRVLRAWLPVGDAMLRIINHHLPSPLEAQPYRAPHLYEGDKADAACQSMRRCDADAPVIFYVSKMVPSPTKGSKGLIAYGRVFAGRITPGTVLYVLGPDHSPGQATSEQGHTDEEGDAATPQATAQALTRAVVRGLVEVNATKLVTLNEANAGAVVGLLGVDAAMVKSGTLAEAPATTYPLKVLRFSVSPVVRVAVSTRRPADAQKLPPAMRRLQQSDPCVQCFVDDQTGERIVAGVGELHVEICVHALNELTGCEIVAAEPVVQYRETVSAESPVGLAKSVNKHNRLFVRAGPLPSPELAQALEDGRITMSQTPVERGRILADVFGVDRGLARRMLAVEGSNMLVDATVGVDLNPIRDMIVLTFRQVCAQGGVLAQEPVHGTCFTVVDAKLHADGAHRRADQILPMVRRALQGAFLEAQPRLLEPIFAVEIQVPDSALGAVRKVLRNRRGGITQDLPVAGTPLHVVSATLPVATSFGFAGDLMGASSGKAFPSCSFSHWQVVEGNPLNPKEPTGALVEEMRRRKRLAKVEVPLASSLLDRL